MKRKILSHLIWHKRKSFVALTWDWEAFFKGFDVENNLPRKILSHLIWHEKYFFLRLWRGKYKIWLHQACAVCTINENCLKIEQICLSSWGCLFSHLLISLNVCETLVFIDPPSTHFWNIYFWLRFGFATAINAY